LLDDTKDFDFSPDGSLLVYKKAGMLFVYDRLLDETVLLGTNGENPANPQFSPDGSRIAYRSLNQSDPRKHVTAISVAELGFDGGALFVSSDSQIISESLRLGNFRGSVISSGPYWSPDGNYLAYGSEDWNSNTSSVMRITADGSNRTNLSSTQSLFVRGWR
jgi:Tol biopolymer transport system component